MGRIARAEPDALTCCGADRASGSRGPRPWQSWRTPRRARNSQLSPRPHRASESFYTGPFKTNKQKMKEFLFLTRRTIFEYVLAACDHKQFVTLEAKLDWHILDLVLAFQPVAAGFLVFHPKNPKH